MSTSIGLYSHFLPTTWKTERTMVLFYLDETEDIFSDVCAMGKVDEPAWVWENLSDHLEFKFNRFVKRTY